MEREDFYQDVTDMGTHLEGYCDAQSKRLPQLRLDDKSYYIGYMFGLVN